MHDPERYETHKSAAARDADVFAPLMVQDVTWRDNETILDYGCGAGSTGNKFLLPQAEKYNSILHSVDISPDMIAFAKKTYSNPRVTFEVGDILQDNFPHKEKKFDKIFTVYVLHFVKNYREALRRFYEILKPGGYFTFTVLSKSSVYLLHEKLGKSEKYGKYMKGIEKFIPEWFEQKEDSEIAFRRSLTEIGYEILQLRPHRQEFTFHDLDTFAELYISLNPFVNEVPKELHADWKIECKDFIRSYWKVPSETQVLTTNYELLYGIARKPL